MKTTSKMGKDPNKLDATLAKAEEGEILSKKEITFLLGMKDNEQIDRLFQAARHLRRKHFGNAVFLYGFIYASTYCRNDCRFCFFRRSNTQSRRYRKATPKIVAAARGLADAGVHLIDLTMGEDPALFDITGTGFDRLIDLVESIRKTTELPVMVSPGVMSPNILARLAEAGASWYACYQETHQRKLFDRLRPGQDYDLRLESKLNAHDLGLLIEEGLLCGAGETNRDIAESMAVIRRLDADQVRVMNFVPQPGTPMEKRTPAEPLKEMLISAVMRLLFPNRLIPASLDVDGLAGLKQRLNAGANVVTSIVPPGEGLAGVAQHNLDIEEGRRTIGSVMKVLEACELRSARIEEYLAWIRSRQEAMACTFQRRKSRVSGGCGR
jgi:methylornithine synthase